MDDRVLALCELQGDLLYHKIPEDQLARYVDESLAAGFEAAEDYLGADLEALYAQRGIDIIWQGSGETKFGVTYRGQSAFGRDGCEVALVRESIEALARHSTPLQGGAPLSCEQALRVHLAHEFFHYLEYCENSPVSARLPAVETLRVLGFVRTAHINKCSEVAAHAFARRVAGLDVLPNYYDYLYLVAEGKLTAEEFESRMARAASLLARCE